MNGAVNWGINWVLWGLILMLLAYAMRAIGLYDLSAGPMGYWLVAIVAAAAALITPVVDA